MPDKYFQSYEEYFWQWEDGSSNEYFWNEDSYPVLAIPGGRTIAFGLSLNELLEGLKDQGLPPFGSLLLTLIALNETAEEDLEEVRWIVSHLGLGSECLTSAMKFLGLLSKVPKSYKSGKNKLILLSTIFENCHNITSLKDSDRSTRILLNDGRNLYVDKIKPAYSHIKHDFRPIDLLNKRFQTIEDILKAISSIPVVDDLTLEDTKQPVDLIDELKQNQKTSKVGSLIKSLQAGLNMPMHSAIKSDQALGGVADLTNKGNYDQLLISEYANDDLVFLSRLANNEALYYSKETPPVNNDLKRIVLLDVSLKNWGSPKIVAYAIAVAIGQMSEIDCEIQLIGEKVQEADFESLGGVIDALQIVESCIDFSVGLEAYFKDQTLSHKQEYFVVTEKSTLEEAEVSKVFADYTASINYLVTTSSQGEIDVYKNLKNGRKHHQHLSLNLEKLWKEQPKKFKEKIVEESSSSVIKEYYPVLVQKSLRGLPLRAANNGEVFRLTKSKSILRLKNKNDKLYTGWEVFYEGLRTGIRDFDIGVLSNGDYVLLTHIIQEKTLYLINLTTKEEIKVGFSQWWQYKEEVFTFEKDSFFYGNDQTSWQIDCKGNLSLSSINKSYLLQHKRAENARLVTEHNTSCSMLKNVKHIGISKELKIVINKHQLTYFDDDNIGEVKFTSAHSAEINFYAEKKSSNEFVFKDGSEIEINSNGIVILKSRDKTLPFIYVPTVLENKLGIATKTMFAGNVYYKNSPGYDIRLTDTGKNKLAIVKLVKNISGLGLKDVKEMVIDSPSNLLVDLSLSDAKEALSKLEEVGAKANLMSQNSAFVNELDEISVEDFFDKYVNRFINNIVEYEGKS